MARPPDWSALPPGTDPTPGDPVEVRRLGAQFTEIADVAGRVHTSTTSMVDDTAIATWIGFSAQAYKKHIEPVPGDIEKLRDSFRIAGTALTSYAGELEKAQKQADKALADAQQAKGDRKAAEGRKSTADSWVTRATTELDKLQNYQLHNIPKPTAAELTAARNDRTSALSAQSKAVGDIGTADQLHGTAKTNRDAAETLRKNAAGTLATELDRASDAGIQNLSWWERAADWFYDNVVPWLKVAVAVLGVIALFVSGPLGWIVFALAAVVLVSTVVQYARGKAGLGDVFMAVLDVLPGMRNLTMLAKNAKWFTKAATVLGGAGRAVRGSKVGGLVKPVAWAAGKTRNGVTAFARNGKVARGYNGTWTASGRFAKTKVAATKFGMQYVTNVGTKYATTLSANYLNGKEVRLWDPAAFVNASAAAVISVGGKGVGDKVKHRLATGRWKSTEPDGTGTPRNQPDPSKAGTQREAGDATKDRHTQQRDQHQQAAQRHETEAQAKHNEATTQKDAATQSDKSADKHEQTARDERAAADRHRDEAEQHRNDRDAADNRATQRDNERAEAQKSADDNRTAAQNHRDAAAAHTKDADKQDATAQDRTQEADQHAKTADDRTRDAEAQRDTAAKSRDEAAEQRNLATKADERADAHETKAREHDAKADRDPANAQQHRDAAAQERGEAARERGDAQTHTKNADDATRNADEADAKATAADRDAATARDAETKARDEATQARGEADRSRDAARDETAQAKQADKDADTAQQKADDAAARRDTETQAAKDADAKATASDKEATQATDRANAADKEAATARQEAAQAREDAAAAEKAAAREEARATDANSRATVNQNRIEGKDADGGARYEKYSHRFLDAASDSLNSKRHWWTGGLNSAMSSMVGKTAENVYLINYEGRQMSAGKFATSVAFSGAGGFAGGAMQQVATKWQVHSPAFTNGPFRNHPGDHVFGLRTESPGWQHATTIEIATKRVGKMLPEAHILGQDLWTNATDWPMGPGP